MMEFIAVGIGGFIGSCFRFGFNKISVNITPAFPLGTLMSNVIAGLIIGFIIGFDQNSAIKPKIKLFLTTGLMGGLSTFSSFSLETINLFQSGKQILAAANIFLNLGLSFLGVIIGITVSKMIFNKT